jgi:hypothetical protein
LTKRLVSIYDDEKDDPVLIESIEKAYLSRLHQRLEPPTSKMTTQPYQDIRTSQMAGS